MSPEEIGEAEAAGAVVGRRSILPAAVLGVIVAAAACGPPSGARGGLSGSIDIDGSSTVFPITQAVAEEFFVEQPGVRISVGVSGTGGGFEKFCRGETEISNASRPIDPEEEEPACERNGIEFVELEVALDGLTVATNVEATFVDCLTLEELRAVWQPGSAIETWSQIRDGFPDEPLALYGPGTDSGTFDYFTEVVVGEEGASRSDYTASEDDNVLVQGVAGDPNALAYFGFAYFEQYQGLVRGLAVDAGDGCVRPTRETITSGEYDPLSRPLYVYVSRSGADRPQVKAFVDFYLENADELAPAVGYVAMPASDLSRERSEWQTFSG